MAYCPTYAQGGLIFVGPWSHLQAIIPIINFIIKNVLLIIEASCITNIE